MNQLKIILIALTFLGAQNLHSQYMGIGQQRHAEKEYGSRLFQYQHYSFKGAQEGKTRVDFGFSLVNDLLTFIAGEQGYSAGYEINIVIYNKKNEIVAFNSARNTVKAGTFEETNLRQDGHRHTISFDLLPGEYRYKIQLFDDESKLILQRSDEIKVRAFGGTGLHISDIVFADKTEKTETGYDVLANLENVFNSINSAFSAYFEVYPSNEQDSVAVSIYIVNKNNRKIFTQLQRFSYKPAIPVVVDFRKNISEPGEYYLHVNVTDGKKSAVVRRQFNVHWGTVPVKDTNIDLAINQLATIVDKSIVKEMLEAPQEEKKKLFEEFWEKRDPTPGTPQNELRQEFFSRVDFANKNFAEVASGRMGWETDRGKVYIKNGPPDEIERNVTRQGMPAAEIWFYAKLNRKYIFSDRSGNGVYRLVKID